MSELRSLLARSRDEKRECDEQLMAARRDVDALTLQLRQKQSELDRARNLVRYLINIVWK